MYLRAHCRIRVATTAEAMLNTRLSAQKQLTRIMDRLGEYAGKDVGEMCGQAGEGLLSC
jgi:hypothetical protein